MKYEEKEINLSVSNGILQTELKNTASDRMIYNNFFSDLRLVHVDKNSAYIQCWPSIIEYVKTNFFQTIQRAVSNSLERKINLILISSLDEIAQVIDKKKTEKMITESTKSNVKDDLTFSNYATGNFNKMALKAAKKICVNYEDISNPLFIHSNSGLGKTHLLHAIGNELNNQNKKCLYINPDNLTRQLVEQLKSKNQEQINKIVDHLTSYDCLMFDDVQQYGNKESTLNVLFNVINTMKTNGKQIIFCADKEPSDLGGFEQRFITRFQGGLIIEINKLQMDDVISVLKFKLSENGIDPELWEEESLRYIGRNFSTSIRAIEGAISRIKLFAEGDDFFTYDLRTIQNIFKNVTKTEENITPEKILETVCKYYGIEKKQIKSISRSKEVVIPRKIAIYLIRNNFDMTLQEIGKMVGDQAHSTIIASLTWIKNNMKKNAALRTAIEKIQLSFKKVV
ncbi:chromosomal replication initiator protein DnaA [Mycoplasma enhydrae]|uniref:chromosomal replication initiator protein DnaA n=1 Tax=Mycoplasma enhydrae TaxID=2499220 RepID=UPI00197C1F93|nr:chromosomal replication initiator protein DnaA [Mycoplasma enhydrae]MBN4089332.1 chromosomal replication initiator protein DnaA [Mycoplasma enhydrae]MCV3733704.1 chromosomal replication initiator protein DnaA [Mycoplasma enhydrae]MCV3753639.1 chromosomal replication initiator protein DnaA [Mycoplasma enhydrae]